MATGFDFASLGNMFAPGGTPTGIDALFNEDQRRLMGRNANLSAAAALLQASGRSRERIGLGQALGSALQAGQQGYQQARAGSLQDLLLGEKLKEAQAARARQASIEGIIGTGVRPAVAGMPAQMVEEDGRYMGETPAVAARPAGFDIQAIAPQLMAQGPEGRKAFGELLAAQKTLMGDTFSLAEGTKQYVRDPITGEVREVAAGAPKREAVPGEIQAYNLAKDQGFTGSFVDFKNALRPPTAPPSAVAEYQFAVGQGYKGTFEQFNQAQRRAIAPKTVVDMTGGQKGFENEMALGSKFKAEPIYKDFSDMKSAFGQVVSSLSAGTPIGDVAGATKLMKLLDPGSVVRESELAIAMQASGRMDRLQNYFNNFMTGQKLTPTQRDDFQALANELYAAAGQAYNAKRGEYEQFGNAYQFKNLGTALGAPATIPSIMRQTPATPGGAMPKKRSLNDIFGGQ
jgi:hypothetical protein